MARTDLPGKIALLVRGCSRVPRRVDRLSAISGTETNAFVSMSRETDVLVSPSLDSLRTLPSKRYAPARAPPIRRNQRHRTSNKNPRTGESIKGFAPSPIAFPTFFQIHPFPSALRLETDGLHRTYSFSFPVGFGIRSRPATESLSLATRSNFSFRPRSRFFPRGRLPLEAKR